MQTDAMMAPPEPSGCVEGHSKDRDSAALSHKINAYNQGEAHAGKEPSN